MIFESLPTQFSFPEQERRVLQFWERHDIFEKSLELRRGAPRFVFYEGPPTANGLPHPGHCLTRAMKDLFPRYQTMAGKLVERKAGWDTHGLPVEVEVCKELGIHTKEEIEAFGVEKFVKRCIDSVFRYTRQWEELTRRLGFWVNLDEAYVTYHQSYVESVWWSLKTLFERDLLYQGHKVVWWWAQGGTALSSGEVGEGYRTVDDPSVYVKFPLVEPPADAAPGAARTHNARPVSLLVWTTTPWTLLSNHFAAVHPDLTYALVHDPEQDEYLYIAAELVEAVAGKVKRELTTVATCRGRDLIGQHYRPPFDGYYATLGGQTAELAAGGHASIGWRVTAADFVTLDSGTGLVHEAPAFGEVDFELLQQERQRFAGRDAIPLICAVAPDGKFTAEAPGPYQGRWVKACDKEITRELRDRGLLYHQEVYRHDYPFCPRAEEDALIQYARQSWFVRTSAFKDAFLENNAQIYWLPDHIRDGRFGDFLRNNVDWALSRERFWGTPLPIWRCAETGRLEAVGSYAELLAKPGVRGTDVWEQAKAADPELSDHLKVHRPYIDAITYDSPFAAGARMQRVIEVIDCWWDAGSMPFAQWGFPHVPGSVERLAEMFPANFISEALDQTRGWFYGLLSISTLLFGKAALGEHVRATTGFDATQKGLPLPYQTCIVLGLMMGEDGLKMSKRKKNYREPNYIFDHYGADALRWFLFSGQTPWTSIRFEEDNIRDAHREFLVRLYNVFSFFNIYANIDGFDPAAATCRGRSAAERSELDRWILSELHLTARAVRAALDRFENFPAAQRLNEFVDALSNWYVRRSRDRFWASDKTDDKWDAYQTLYDVLLTLAKLIAPFTPHFAELMYHNLCGIATDTETLPQTPDAAPSVHLCDYPTPALELMDEDLAQEMALVRQIVSQGRAARTAAKLKVRQPLALAEIILARQEHTDWLQSHAGLIAEELNIKAVEFTTEADHYVSYQVKPNFKTIGPAFGKDAPKVAKALGQVDAAAARRTLVETGRLPLTVDGRAVELTDDQVEIRLEAKPGWSAAQGRAGVVVVKTELTDCLIEEGLVRELIHHVQALRKERDLPYQARVGLRVDAPAELTKVLQKHANTVEQECLISRLDFGPADGQAARAVRVEAHPVTLALDP